MFRYCCGCGIIFGKDFGRRNVHLGCSCQSSPLLILQVTRFEGSVMQRILLSVDILIQPPLLLPTNKNASHYDGKPPLRIRVWTSHLESCADYAKERKKQLQHSWAKMKRALYPANPPSVQRGETPTPDYAIFCGDMNIRDTEVRRLSAALLCKAGLLTDGIDPRPDGFMRAI